MSAKRSLGRLRRRPRPEDPLAGADDDKVRAAPIEEEVYLKVTRLSDIKAMPAPRVEKSAGDRHE